MDPGLFIQGIIIGLTLAVPVGPISLVCIHRTVAGGRLHGIVAGLGVATADSLYAAVAFLGLTAVSGLIIGHQALFRLLAGIALILVGIRVFRSVLAAVSDGDGQEPYLQDYLSLFAIAAANPLTIIFFITILPGFSVVAQGTTLVAAVPFVAGVFLGVGLPDDRIHAPNEKADIEFLLAGAEAAAYLWTDLAETWDR